MLVDVNRFNLNFHFKKGDLEFSFYDFHSKVFLMLCCNVTKRMFRAFPQQRECQDFFCWFAFILTKHFVAQLVRIVWGEGGEWKRIDKKYFKNNRGKGNMKISVYKIFTFRKRICLWHLTESMQRRLNFSWNLFRFPLEIFYDNVSKEHDYFKIKKKMKGKVETSEMKSSW